MWHDTAMRTVLRVSSVVLLLWTWGGPAAALHPKDAVGVYLTWHGDPTSSVTVNWVDLYENSGDTVLYRPHGQAEAPWDRASGEHSRVADSVLRVHRVELKELSPDTVYEFAIGDEPPAIRSHVYRFRTMPLAPRRPIRFVTGGDMMHAREMADAMNKVAGKLAPDFALLGGDLAYANDVLAMPWVDWLQSWTIHARTPQGLLIPMIAVIGNHEVSGGGYGGGREQARYYYDLFAPPAGRSNFATDFGTYLSILALDSHHSQPVPEQTRWLEEALEERQDQQFLFAVYHYPAYGTTKAPQGALPSDAEVSKLIQAEWVPLFERFGLTAVFENDHHTYKRTHRLRNGRRDDSNGILYLGDGCWGVATRPVPAPGSVWYLARAESRNHLWQVTLDGGKATFEAIDVEGHVFDRVTTDRARTRPVRPGEPVTVGD